MFNNYEIVEYTHSLPLQIQNFTGRTIQDDRGDIKDVLEHWHQEIEIVYTFEGHALHYIDGKVHRAAPGKLFVTNSESIHKVISDEGTLGMPEVIAVVLLVNVDFVKKAGSEPGTDVFPAGGRFGYGENRTADERIFLLCRERKRA